MSKFVAFPLLLIDLTLQLLHFCTEHHDDGQPQTPIQWRQRRVGRGGRGPPALISWIFWRSVLRKKLLSATCEQNADQHCGEQPKQHPDPTQESLKDASRLAPGTGHGRARPGEARWAGT